jgi:hypothetical protein
VAQVLELGAEKSVRTSKAGEILQDAQGFAGAVGGGIEDARDVHGLGQRRQIKRLVQAQGLGRRTYPRLQSGEV